MRAIEDLMAPEKASAKSAAKTTAKTNSKPKTRSLLPIVDTLPKAITRKLHELEQEARSCDEAVENAKKALKEAKDEADAAHAALLEYVRALTDPDYFPLFKATVDQETGEIVHTGDETTGVSGTAHGTPH